MQRSDGEGGGEGIYIPGGVEDGELVAGERAGHAVVLAIQDDKVHGDEEAAEEEEAAHAEEEEARLLERHDEVHDVEGLGLVVEPRLGDYVCDEEKAEEHERQDTHGPAKANSANELVEHDSGRLLVRFGEKR